MNRRVMLKATGLGMVGWSLGACAGRARPDVPARVPRAPFFLPKVRASWDRVIHTTVGLRPHRPSGFVVKPEKLDETLVVNCSGLGSRDLFHDDELIPLKGQLTLLVPQPEIDCRTAGGLESSSGAPGIGIHMNPRSDGIALGGTSERGEWSLEPNAEARQRIVDSHIALFSAMRSAPVRSS